MLTLTEIVYAIRGLSLLVRFDARGLEYFDRSIQGFWRSFQVAVLVAPVHALALQVYLPLIEPTAPWGRILFAVIGLYIIGWLIYPVIVFEVCRIFGKQAEYVGYIAVYNWLALIAAFAHLLILMPAFLGLWGAESSAYLSHVVYFALLAVALFVVRNGLRIEWLPATGFVFLDYVLSEILNSALIGMLK